MSLRSSPLSAQPSTYSSPAANQSNIQVDVTFNDPVVFAGQALVAVVTFRNTQKPPQATDPLESLNSTNTNSNNAYTPTSNSTNTPRPAESGTQDTQNRPPNAYPPQLRTPGSPSSISSLSQPTSINTKLGSGGAPLGTAESVEESVSTRKPSSSETTTTDVSFPRTDSPVISLTEPTSPVGRRPNTTERLKDLTINDEPDDGIPMASEATISELSSETQLASTTQPLSQKEREEPKHENLWGWDIPGRRLSSQIANTFRDFYFNNNASSPDVHRTNPVSHLRGSSSSGGVQTSSLGSLASTTRLQRSGSQSISRPSSRRYIGSGGVSSLRDARPGAEYEQNVPQSLLMGYAQVQGYYVLDDELIDVDEFAHVKTQGVVVGKSGNIEYGSSQGGGLLQGLASGLGSLFQIREPPRSGSGSPSISDGRLTPTVSESRRVNSPITDIRTPERLGRTLSWGRGRGRPSSPASARITAGSTTPEDAIPIFSTPQSLLFVDLKLAPGESKTFYYKLQLPKSIPPSCRAKSIRIHYNLVVGTQKLSHVPSFPGLSSLGNETLSQGKPQPTTTFVPFRVFPYVDRFGQQYTHDLKTPIVLQRDTALVFQLPPDLELKSSALSPSSLNSLQNSAEKAEILAYFLKMEAKTSLTQNTAGGQKDTFMNYLNDVLDQIETSSSQETSPEMRRPSLPIPPTPQTPIAPLFSRLNDNPIIHDTTTQENIDYFTRFQQVTAPMKPLKTRFDIGRGGKRIATVTLSKAVYRVGENMVFTVDFKSAALKCFHVTASLETEESISSRVLKQFKDHHFENGNDQNERSTLPVVDTTELTRRIYSQATMSTYSISKSAFEFTVPATATPQFSTSEIALKWVLKLDFITSPASAPPLVFGEPARTNPINPRLSLSSHHRPSTDGIEGESLNATVPDQHERATEEQFQQQHQHVPHSSSSQRAQSGSGEDTGHVYEETHSTTAQEPTQKPTIDPFDMPDDPHSALEVVHLSDKGLIAVAKETIACELFHCKIPLTVIPTNQDIRALLQHSIAPTRSFRI